MPHIFVQRLSIRARGYGLIWCGLGKKTAAYGFLCTLRVQFGAMAVHRPSVLLAFVLH